MQLDPPTLLGGSSKPCRFKKKKKILKYQTESIYLTIKNTSQLEYNSCLNIVQHISIFILLS